MGDGLKRPTLAELKTKKVVQKAIVVNRAIRAGEKITSADLALRRTSNGLTQAYLPLVIGRCVRRDLEANSTLSLDMLQ